MSRIKRLLRFVGTASRKFETDPELLITRLSFPDGNWIRNIVFTFPVPVQGTEVKELPLEKSTLLETIILLSKKTQKRPKWLENKGFPESCPVKGYDSGGPFFCSGEPVEAEGSRLRKRFFVKGCGYKNVIGREGRGYKNVIGREVVAMKILSQV